MAKKSTQTKKKVESKSELESPLESPQIDIDGETMEIKIKKNRARSKEDKEVQMQKIINGSMELISKHGFNGFGMRALASHLGISQGNLYNYIISMRELWIAVRIKWMREFKEGMIKIAYSDKGQSGIMNLIQKISEYVLNFAAENENRWKLITAIPPPAPPSRIKKDDAGNDILDNQENPIKEDIIGPIEKGYQSVNVMSVVFEVLQRGNIQGELNLDNYRLIGYYLYAVILGATYIEHELNLKDEIAEPMIEDPNQFDLYEFRELMFSQMKHLLKII